ncbi:MAG: hypothetical protein AB7F89_12755 [Pirellulaceae bacterium]
MASKKTTVLPPHTCPVCGKLSYSRAGIHPQCAVRREDEISKQRIKREERLAPKSNLMSARSKPAPWQKICPKCNVMQHARKTTCSCGYHFPARTSRPPGDPE